VTSLALARAYTEPVNFTVMLARQCQTISESPVTYREHDRISDHRGSLLRSEIDDFVVVSEDGAYVGIATRRLILNPPRARLILVDHNELSQAVGDAEEAEIIGVLDHHRLGNPPTAAPIPFVVDPVGSTSTLVAEHCQAHGLRPPTGLAGMLLSGILSDTLAFRSPTATPRDRTVAAWLAEIAAVDSAVYGEELLRAAPGLTARAIDEIIDADRKSYQMDSKSVSIGQVEVTGFEGLSDRRADLLAALEDRRQREALDFIALMVTDIVTSTSHLLCRGEGWIIGDLPFTRVAEGEFDLENMVSRKKQLVPSLHAVLEDSH
jgi:manganese-dependent inorganic pyrophosphatase